MINFGPWLPDQADFSNPGLTTATNVVPFVGGYRSFPQPSAYSGSATATIRGIFPSKNTSGSAFLFAGDAGKLYKFNAATAALDDVSKVGGYTLTGNQRWKFAQFGEVVLATGGITSNPQKFDLTTDTIFSDLAGSPPTANHIAIVRDFVWLADVNTGSGRVPYRVYWSGFNDAESWTAGTAQSDFQDIVDAGHISGIVGGEYCTILMERAIVRATYTGPPLIWQFDKVETQRGCKVPNSICHIGSLIFYLSDDGFYAFDGQRSTAIGNEKVDDFFNKDFNSGFAGNMTAGVDPVNKLAFWCYASVDSIDGSNDKVLVYNYEIGRWSLLETAIDYIAPFFSAAYTVDALDTLSATIDAFTIQTDSPALKGGEYFFGCGVGDKLFTFNGSPLSPSTIETGEAALSTGKHSIITRLYPYFDAGTVEASIGVRNTTTNTVSFSASTGMNTDGFVPFRATGRYHRAKLLFTNSHNIMQGIDFEARQVGRR